MSPPPGRFERRRKCKRESPVTQLSQPTCDVVRGEGAGKGGRLSLGN